MSLLVVGLSHRTAPTNLLEAAAIPVDDIPKLLDDLLAGEQPGRQAPARDPRGRRADR